MCGGPKIRRDQLGDVSLELLKKTVISGVFEPEQYADLAAQIMLLVAETFFVTDLYDIWSIVISKMTKLKTPASLDGSFIRVLCSHLDDNNANFRAPQNTVLINCLNKAIQNLNFNPHKQDVLLDWSLFLVDSFNNSRIMLSTTEICLRSLSGESILTLHSEKSNFIGQLFNNFSVRPLANASSKCLQAVYVGLLAGVNNDVGKWFDLWDNSFFQTLMNKEKSSNFQTYLLPAIIKLRPETLKLFIDRNSKQLLDNDDHIHVLISLLTIGEQCNIDFSSIVSFEFLLGLLSINSCSILCSCLELLVLSAKSSLLNTETLDAVKQCVVNFTSDCNSVNVRNNFSNALNAFISKVKDASYRLFKSNRTQLSEPHHDFLNWLLSHLKNQLLPLASYSQTIIGFSILKKLIDLDLDRLHPIDDKDNLLVFPYSTTIFDERLLVLLFDKLNSNYDDIRYLALTTLTKCPSDVMIPVLNYNDEILGNELIRNSFKLCFSLKSRESEGGARFFQFYCRFFALVGKKDRIVDMFNFLLDYLNKLNIEAPFGNEITVEDRIHGIFTALSLMLSELPNTFFDDDKYWSNYFSSVVSLNTKVWNKVEPVLTGLLDDDEGDFTDDRLVINFSWKTIKESNNLMNVVFRINSASGFRFMKSDKLAQFVNLLVDQLSRIKHRGTVASIYPIFVDIIKVCFQSEDSKKLPYDLLDKNIYLIEKLSQAISRRSGGLPNLITGILTAEKSVLGSCDASMNKTFEKLLAITQQELNPNYIHDLPQVNALNSIRSIFNDSYLANDSAPYLVNALSTCLDNFNSTNWSVKNCSLMLFSTLKNKLFSSSFKLLSLNFFKKYPNLKDKILQNLQNKHVEIVFSSLELVSRLNFIQNKSDLQQFSDMIIELLGLKSWLIREMLARTLGLITLPDMVADVYQLLVNTLAADPNKNHGIMLSILELLKSNPKRIPLELSTSIFGLNLPYRNWSTLKVYVQILDLLLETPSKILSILGNILLQNLDTEHNGLKKLATTEILSFLLKSYHQKGDYESLDYLIQITFDLNFEFSNVVMEFLKEHPKSATNFNDLWNVWGRDDYTHLKLLAVLCQMKPMSLTDKQVELLSQEGDSEIRAKSLELLSTFIARGDIENLKQYYVDSIVEFCQDDMTESVRLNCLRSVTNYIKSSEPDEIALKSLVTLIRLMSDDEDSIRQQANSALSDILGLKIPRSLQVCLGFVHGHVRDNYDTRLTEKIIVETIITYDPSIESKLNEFTNGQTQDSLFDVEVLNFYRQDVQMIEFLYSIVDNLTEDSLQKLKSKCVRDCRQIIAFCINSGTDGFLGYSRNELVFGAIAQGIAELNSLRALCNDVELNGLHQELSKTLKVNRLHLELQNMLKK